jgi:hypothetical protein
MMTRQNAIILQALLIPDGRPYGDLISQLTEMEYDTREAAVRKANDILDDIQGDIDAGRGKEADEAIEEYGSLRPVKPWKGQEAPGDGADDEGTREEFLKRWRDSSGEEEVR